MKTKILLLTAMAISSITMNAQTTMNIYQSNGTVLQIPLSSIDSITYTITNPGNLATLTTLSIANITGTTASSGGNITNNGGTPVTQRGVVWNTSPNPTTTNSQSIDGSGTGSFTSNLTGLTTNTTYYARAYAINSAGTAYGNELSFTTTTTGGSGIVSNPGSGVVFDGYTYTSIVLGNGQEWMAENLRTTTYANGEPIPNETGFNQWVSLTTGAWEHFNNDSQYENPYGKLYNWYTVDDPRNVCPTGWHVPSDAEWMILSDYLGGEPVAGGKMKSTGTQYWTSPNQDATNESGFTGYPGGGHGNNGPIDLIGNYGHWWSSTEEGTSNVWCRGLGSNGSYVSRISLGKQSGFSVRCLRD